MGTEAWRRESEYRDDPDRLQHIAEIVQWLREENDVAEVSFITHHNADGSPSDPVRIAVRPDGDTSPKWILHGLWPSECDTLRSLLVDREWMTGANPSHEGLVVGTLATLLHHRGICLRYRTICYLHGEPVKFYSQEMDSEYSQVSLAHVVDDDGWDAAASYVVKVQEKLLRQAREVARETGELRRRGPGRPPKNSEPEDREINDFLREQYLDHGFARRAAREAASRFEISESAALQRIHRSPWYQKLPHPASPDTAGKIEPVPEDDDDVGEVSAVRFGASLHDNLPDEIARQLSDHNATTEELARAVHRPFDAVHGCLLSAPERFRFTSGQWRLLDE